MVMKTKRLASNKMYTKVHTDLKQQKKPDVINLRKCRRKVGQSWNNTVDDEKKGKDTKEETHDCHICGKQFKRKNNLSLHRKHHNSKAKKDSCNEGFTKVMVKQEHELKCERNESQSRLECSFCDLPCDTPKELRIHENKHKPMRKTKNNKNKCVCIECEKAFDSIPSLKVHIQKDHVKPEPSSKETVSIKEENTSSTLTDVSNLTNQLQYGRDHTEDKPSSMLVSTEVNKEKPFMCLHCGSRYKYKHSKIAHELKYHGKSELTPTEDSSQENKTSQVFNKDESVGLQDKETLESGDNNNTILKIKEENDSVPDKKCNRPNVRFRTRIIKKRCIGCDKAFDISKDKDEHELECGLNCFNRKFNCMFCGHPFSKPKTLRKHENKHRPAKKTKRYKHRCVCIECNKTFDAIYTLRVHMQKLHRKGQVLSQENKPFACRLCNARFKYENSKCKHEMRRHSADLGQKDNVLPNFKVNDLSDPGGLPVESGEEHTIKEEPCGEDSLEYHTVCDIKTEVDADVDPPLNSPSGIMVEEADGADKASSPSQQTKRKGKQPVERNQKKQKTGPFVCNNCEAEFNSPQGLWLHSYHQNMRTKRLSCIGCGKTFKSEKDTQEHELRCNLNHNEYDFNCMFCDDTFGNPKLLRNHELKHRPRRMTKNHKCVCIDCRKPFDSIQSLKKHIRKCHRNHVQVEEVYTQTDEQRLPSVEDMKSCYVLLKDIDGVRAKKGKGIRRSCRAKSRRTRVVGDAECKPGSEDGGDTVGVKEECTTGGYDISGEDIKRELDDLIEEPTYLVETELANPEELMQDGEPGSFHCVKCNLNFDSHEKLRHHSYSHRQRTKRLFCIGCGEGFEQSNDKDRHELECRVNLTNRHFNCIFCELPFSTPQKLRSHEKKHRPPKRYKRYKHMCLCAECDRAFDAVLSLKVHIRNMHRRSKEKVKIKEEI